MPPNKIVSWLQELGNVAVEELANGFGDNLQGERIAGIACVQRCPLLVAAAQAAVLQQGAAIGRVQARAARSVRTGAVSPANGINSFGFSRLVSSRQLWCRPSPICLSSWP